MKKNIYLLGLILVFYSCTQGNDSDNNSTPLDSNNLKEWGNYLEWDHNQIGTAWLVFFDDSSFNYDIHEKVSEVIYGQIFNTLSDEMQEFLNKEYQKKEDAEAQLSLF